MNSNELISRYVYHVGKHLPPDRREDVARELVSLIGDRVDDEPGAAGDRDAVVLRVLREMGPPEQVAARYGYERRLLIGTHAQPAFFMLVKVVPVAVFALSLLNVNWLGDLSSGAFWKWLLGYLNSVLINLGLLVLIFVFLERLSAFRTKPEAVFDPARLSPAPRTFDGGKVRPAATVLGIYALVAVFVVFNFYPNIFGVWTRSDSSGFWSVPFSALGLHVPLWLLNFWLAGSIVLRVEVLREGRWTRETRWFHVGLDALGLAVVLATLALSKLGQLDVPLLASAGISPSDPKVVALAQACRALAFAAAPLVFFTVVSIAKDVWRLSRRDGLAA